MLLWLMMPWILENEFLIWTLAWIIVLCCVIEKGKLLLLHRGAYLHSAAYWHIGILLVRQPDKMLGSCNQITSKFIFTTIAFNLAI